MTAAIQVWGAPEGWDAFLLAQRRREHAGPVLHVCRDDARAARMADALGFIMPEAEILRFPAWDCLPYDRASPALAVSAQRLATLHRLQATRREPQLLVTTVNALLQRVLERARGLGFEAFGSLEYEFFLFQETPESVREKGFRDLKPFTPDMMGYSMLRSSGHSELYHELLGLAEAGFFPGVILYLTYWFPSAYRARIIGIFMISIPISSFLGSPISGALLNVTGLGLAGWQWLFILEGLPAVFLAVAVLWFLPDGPRDAAWLPAGTPADIIARMNEWFATALSRPRVRDYLFNAGSNAFTTTPDELMKFQIAEHDKWRKVILAAGIQPE